MNRDQWQQLFQKVMEYIRENYEGEIDQAYEYFWEEESPEEFIGGTALTMSFHNFEDWLACDYKPKDKDETFIDRYIKDKSPSDEEMAALNAMKDSFVSLFEVKSVADQVTLNDIATTKDINVDDDRLKALGTGDMFGARIMDLGNGPMLTNAIYPFGSSYKEYVMKNLDSMYNRYAKHCEGEACMEDFLRQETYTINTVWVTSLFRAK